MGFERQFLAEVTNLTKLRNQCYTLLRKAALADTFPGELVKLMLFTKSSTACDVFVTIDISNFNFYIATPLAQNRATF